MDIKLFRKINSCIHDKRGNLVVEELKKEVETHYISKSVPSVSKMQDVLKKELSSPYNEIFGLIIECSLALDRGDLPTAYDKLEGCLSKFLTHIQEKPEPWLLDILYWLISELKHIAMAVGHKNYLEAAARLLMKTFTFCSSDKSRKAVLLHTVNQLFKIYFHTNLLRLATNLVKSIEASDIETFPRHERITYSYYAGRLALLDSNYKASSKNLEYCFNQCPSFNNKKMTLQYLLCVRLLQGIYPTKRLLMKYQMADQWYMLIKAVRDGNVAAFNLEIKKNMELFIRQGIYLILEKARLVTYRNFFKRVFLLDPTNTRMPLQRFQVCLNRVMKMITPISKVPSDDAGGGNVMDLDEIECILSSLIYQQYVMGYISHERRYLILSKDNPFPKLSSGL